MTALDDPDASAKAIAQASEAETPPPPGKSAGIARFAGPVAVFGFFSHLLASTPKLNSLFQCHSVLLDHEPPKDQRIQQDSRDGDSKAHEQ